MSNRISTPETSALNSLASCSCICSPGRSASALRGTCSAFSASRFTAAERMVTQITSTQSTHSSLKSCGMTGENVSTCTNGQNFHPALMAFHQVAWISPFTRGTHTLATT